MEITKQYSSMSTIKCENCSRTLSSLANLKRHKLNNCILMSTNQKRTIMEVAESIVNGVSIMLECNADTDHINKKIKTIILNDSSFENTLTIKNHFNESNANILEGLIF